MATAPIVRYALDPTGINPDNRVNGEVKTLSGAQIRAIAPQYGPFFSESLTIYDNVNNRLLVRGRDYQIIELLQEATLRFGKEIAQLVLIINPDVNEEVRVNYQVLGGLFQNNMQDLVNMYDTIMKDGRPVDWSRVLNKPLTYPPTLHRHFLEDVVGFEPVVVALERIRNAITLSDVPAFETLVDWVKANSGKTVLVHETVRRLRAKDVQEFNVQTSNLKNDTKIYWKVVIADDVNLYFENPEGFLTLFQNRGKFTFRLKNKSPLQDTPFTIELRIGDQTASVSTTVEGIILHGIGAVRDNGEMTIMDMFLACCMNDPDVQISAASMYIIGEKG